MEKTRRRGWRKQVFGLSAIIFAASFIVSLVPSIRAIAEGAIFKIKSAEITQLSSGVDGAISSHDDSTIVSDVTFHKLGDTATYKVVLQNTDSKDHVIETISDDNVNSHISYSYDKHTNETIAAGSNLDFVFEAKYTKTPNTNERQQVSKVKFSIRFTDIDEPEEVIVAPSTYDGLGASFVVLAISSLGLIVCAAIYIKNHKKAAKILTAALVAALATAAITSVKAATVEVNSFTLTTNYGFYDKVVVTYTDKNGDERELISNYNEPANIPDQSKDGYTLTGWEDEQGNPVDPTQPIAEDVKIHPIYRAHTYTVKFNGNGATSGEMANLAMTYDETKTLPANAFNFPGRTYAGWDTEANGSGIHYDDQAEVKNLTAEDNGIVTLYAQWSINPFHIDYDGNGATSGEMATTNCEYDSECVLRENAFAKTGYHFVGWKYSNNDYADKADVKNIIEGGTITMVAQWEVNHYTIVFDINTDDSNAAGDMADMANLEYDHDYTLTANAFTRTGYNFGGWNTEIDGRNFGLTDEQEFHNLTTTDNAVITLYAQWNPIHYTIAFHQNSDGVTGNMSSQVFTYDEEKQLTQNAFVKDHYKFMGWTTAANGTGTKYDDQASIFNLTTEDGATIDLYAQWKERTAYLKGTVNNSWGSAGDMIRSLQGYSAATSFSHYEGEPNFDEIETKYNMAISSSNFPVYTWIDGETIYWWSEAETIYAHEDSRNFFSGLKKAETIDYSGFNFSLTKNLTGFFRNTAALSTIDLSPLAVANPTTLEEMFYGSGIASVDLSPLNTTQTTNMKGMFNSTTTLETVNLSAINTANVTDMSYLFSNSTNLKSVDFSHNNLSSVEDMNHMFYSDKKLESLNFTGVNTPNLKKMSWMFGGAKIANLDLSDLDTGNVTHFDELFYHADVANLDISGFDTHNATTFGSMFTAFNAHGQVLDLSHFDTTSLNGSMYEMFNGTNASVIDLSSFDISAVRVANIGMANILHISNSVETIYATEKLHFHDYSSVPDTNLGVPMDYGGQSKLVGGAGSTLPQLTLLGLSEYDKARIDDPDNGKPGMFTIKGARYIRYNGNGADNATPYGAMTSEYLKAGDSLKKNAFTRRGFRFNGWKDADDNEYTDEQAMTDLTESKTPLELYAQWEELTATLNAGANVNAALRGLTAAPTTFKHFDGENLPDFDNLAGKVNIALTSSSNTPVWAWADGDTIYWWSEAETVYMNASTYNLFGNMSTIKTIDLAGLDSSSIVNATNMFIATTSLETVTGMENWRGDNLENAMNMFKDSGIISVSIPNLMTSKATNIGNMFYNCQRLTAVDADNWDVSGAEKMSSMFYNTYALQTISGIEKWEGKHLQTTHEMFGHSGIETLNVGKLVTEATTDVSGMFSYSKITYLDLSDFDFSNVENMFNMFAKMSAIESIIFPDDINTSRATTMAGLFNDCPNLQNADVSNFDTANVKDMNGMFRFTPMLANVDVSGFDTSSLEGAIESMFSKNGTAVLDLTTFDTSRINVMRNLFLSNTAITTIYASDDFKTELVPNQDVNSDGHNLFKGATNLVGGAGTSYANSPNNNKEYARIDDPDNGEPGYFTIKGARYIRYNGNGADNATPYGAMRSEYLKAGDSLKKNAFVRDGYIFTGWKDADNNDYTDEQVMAGLVESKTPLELYAQWGAAPYTVTLNANGGEVLQSAKTVTYLQPYGELPTPVRYDFDTASSILSGKYEFKEWNTKADGTGDTITSGSIYANAGDTTLYAIWNDRFTVTIYNGESETPTIASYGIDDEVELNAQNVAGKQFLYWEVDGAKKSYSEHYSMHMFQGKDLTIRAIYGSESDLESRQPDTYISDIYRQYSNNKIVVRSYSYVPDEYEIVKSGVIATLDANIANGTFDDQTATYVRPDEDNDNIDDYNYYFTWSKSNVISEQTVYVKAYLKYKDADGVEHTIYGDMVTATLTE
ncbi:BspA family leucine-rich repeat surface protein [Candidatus Saccharibacteria bacterium]|nr:BspA family leucine-rich repeat surface protein [Candidatus Saccharibacteria bacterium]